MEIICTTSIDSDTALATTIDWLLQGPAVVDNNFLIVACDIFCGSLLQSYFQSRFDLTTSSLVSACAGPYFDSFTHEGIKYMHPKEDRWMVDDLSKVTFVTKQLCPALFPVLDICGVVLLLDSSAVQPRSLTLVALYLAVHNYEDISNIESTTVQLIPISHIKYSQYPLQLREWGKEADLKSAVSLAVDAVLSTLDWDANFTEASKLMLHRLAFGMARLTVNPHLLDNLDHKITAQLQSNKIQQPLASTSPRSCLSARSAVDGIKVFEFFSGIGGMRLALPDLIHGQSVREICAVDVSLIANAVYTHNFHTPLVHHPQHIVKNSLHQGDIKAFGVKELDGQSHIWTMSPPCQPFTKTRGARQLDNHDTRSQGLYHLLHMLLSIQTLPEFIIMENVAAFRGSYMHSLWREVLQHVGYEAKEMTLSPHFSVGLPNSRTRYFCVARFIGRSALGLEESSAAIASELLASTQLAVEAAVATNLDEADIDNDEEEPNDGEDTRNGEAKQADQSQTKIAQSTSDGSATPFSMSLRYQGSILTLRQVISDLMGVINQKVLAQDGEYVNLLVSREVLSSSWAPQNLSLVDGSDTLTYCFTKGYGKRVDHSAGSCLVMNDIASKDIDRSRLIDYHGQIRLFHPDELLLLFGYPAGYAFPEGMSLQHRWGCIGNSVNVKVVSKVMQYLFDST